MGLKVSRPPSTVLDPLGEDVPSVPSPKRPGHRPGHIKNGYTPPFHEVCAQCVQLFEVKYRRDPPPTSPLTRTHARTSRTYIKLKILSTLGT